MTNSGHSIGKYGPKRSPDIGTRDAGCTWGTDVF